MTKKVVHLKDVKLALVGVCQHLDVKTGGVRAYEIPAEVQPTVGERKVRLVLFCGPCATEFVGHLDGHTVKSVSTGDN